LCNKHATEQSNWWIPCPENSWTELKKQKNNEIREFLTKVTNAEENPRGLMGEAHWTATNANSEKRPELLERLKNTIEMKCMTKIMAVKPKTADESDLIDLGRNMRRQLDVELADDFAFITHVVIENQISPIATRMKTVQGMLTQYFIQMCPESTHIEYISSTNKLRISPILAAKALATEALATTVVATETLAKKNTYADNKKDCVKYGSQILAASTDGRSATWVEFANTHKKRDDLFDAFLQGLAFLEIKLRKSI
jgi:hypothetical protein